MGNISSLFTYLLGLLVSVKSAVSHCCYVNESRGRGLRAMSGLNCELYRRCLSSSTGCVVMAAAVPCTVASSCSVRCLSCCSRRRRSARSSSIDLVLSCFSLLFLCRWWPWRTPCAEKTVTVSKFCHSKHCLTTEA